MHRLATLVLTLGLSTALASVSSAQTTPERPEPPAQPREQVAAGDRASDHDFARKAAMSGKKEADGAKFAAGRASNREVKAYANQLVTDHTKVNRELAGLMRASMSRDGAMANTDAMKADKDAMKADKDAMSKDKDTAMADEPEAWRAERGPAFDRAFLDHVVQGHEASIALYEEEARAGTDPQMKAWAEKTLPALRQHLQSAKDLQGKIVTSNRQ